MQLGACEPPHLDGRSRGNSRRSPYAGCIEADDGALDIDELTGLARALVRAAEEREAPRELVDEIAGAAMIVVLGELSLSRCDGGSERHDALLGRLARAAERLHAAAETLGPLPASAVGSKNRITVPPPTSRRRAAAADEVLASARGTFARIAEGEPVGEQLIAAARAAARAVMDLEARGVSLPVEVERACYQLLGGVFSPAVVRAAVDAMR